VIPAAGRHGGDGPAVAAALGIPVDQILDLSLTLNPFAPDVTAIAARHLDALRHYPDDRAAAALLAQAIGVDPHRVLLTNGGSEAIALVDAAVGGGVVSEPEFALHPRRPAGPRWRSNPHNPTGVLAADDDRADVWDEAFYPLATGSWSRGDADAIVVGSLTKLFACPGLRLGYVVAHDVPAVASRLPEWSVNGLALAMVAELLEQADLAGWAKRIADQRVVLADVLSEHGLPSAPSDAPWLLVDAPALRQRLAPSGVVVRDCASFGLEGWARVAVPDDDGLARLDHALTITERGAR
jgi:histidinol-phosphate/aromatic aminotransferase/cobyric acid decarboxylase-like protein